MAGRLWPAIGSLAFFVLAPAAVGGLIPQRISRWRMQAPFFAWAGLRPLGAGLILTGTVVLLDCFARFALQGRGTPAPVYPTERLVVGGWYRYVRNPMYVAVLSVVLGQALLLGSRGLLTYAALLGVAFHLFVLLYEEPTLRGRYGAGYTAYCAAVRRWWPRLRPWPGNGP